MVVVVNPAEPKFVPNGNTAGGRYLASTYVVHIRASIIYSIAWFQRYFEARENIWYARIHS